jgi:hypothetical protein
VINRASRTFLILLVVLAGAVFVARGPVRWANRGDSRYTDLTGAYLGTKAWVRGLNPYSPDVFWAMAGEAGWEIEVGHDGFQSRTPYPLTTFVLLAPLALLPWSSARIVFMAFTACVVVLAVAALTSLSGVRESRQRRDVLLALGLLLAPLHTGIGTGNPSALAVGFTVVGVWAGFGARQVVAGVLLGLALCFKPLIPLFALGYYTLRGRWRIPVAATGTVGAIGVVGALRLQVAGVWWLPDYLYNNGILFANHGGAIIEGSDSQLQFINLQFLGVQLFGDTRMASLLALTIGGGLVLIWLVLLLRRRARRSELLALSALAVISLLPIYHRVYDAGLLLLPLCWALARPEGDVRWPRLLTLVLLMPFFVPGITFLELQIRNGRIPESLVSAWWWNALVLPHQVWALTLMAVVLLAALARTEGRALRDSL